MTKSDDKARARVAAFVERMVNQSPLQQKEIADMCGFSSPNVITMIKQGATKVPIEKIPRLAKALDIDRREFFSFVMKNYKPKEYEAIVEVMGEPITDAELKVLNLIRDLIPEGQLIGNTPYYLDKIRHALMAN